MSVFIIQSTKQKIIKFQSIIGNNPDIKVYNEYDWYKRHADLINREIVVVLLPFKTKLKMKKLKKELFEYYDHLYLIKSSKKDYYKEVLSDGIKKIYESI